jgi:hypothetical protein
MATTAQIDKWLEQGKGGYTLDQLKEGWELVRNKEHWKNDIDAVIPAEMERVVSYAIPWFAGGGDMEFLAAGNGKIRVVASGYWSNGMDG